MNISDFMKYNNVHLRFNGNILFYDEYNVKWVVSQIRGNTIKVLAEFDNEEDAIHFLIKND